MPVGGAPTAGVDLQRAPRILVVDDDWDCLNLCVLFLERTLQADVIAVASVADAQAHVANGNFDCVVSDCNLPEGDGRELLKQVARAWPDIPRVLMSGYLSRSESRVVLADEVAHAFVHKRDISTELPLVIKRLLVTA